MDAQGQALFDALLEGWQRHNRTMINLLQVLPAGALDWRVMPGSPTIAASFSHLHHERMISVLENAPECAGQVPAKEWQHEPDASRLAAQLSDSAERVQQAVRTRVLAGRGLDRDFAHPSHLLQFLIFHEAYHHGQIKLALKAAGQPLPDAVAGPLIWDVWRAR